MIRYAAGLPRFMRRAERLRLPAQIALAALLAGLRVALRRNKDDFGRDYYAYATRTTAWWAAG
jgi:hypothetical protein